MIEQSLAKMKKASVRLASAESTVKDRALRAIIDNLKKHQDDIFAANQADLERSGKEKLAAPLLKRLKFDQKKLDGTLSGVADLTKLDDPVGKELSQLKMDDGLILTKVTVPIGVIGVIFESRPDALVQIATLCIKSGNCVVLKGGREALETNRILAKLINEALLSVDELFRDTVLLLETREDIAEILQYDQYINLIIPRGSNEFVQYIQKSSAIPVLGHADGICHVYVDAGADIDTAVAVVNDSKTQYVAVCNAAETLLVHKDIADDFLPKLKSKLDGKNVEVKGDAQVQQILSGIDLATEEDWKTEYLDYILSIKIVDSVDEAIDHINTYGSGHTDAIVTSDNGNANHFQRLVDSASVLVNCSTRFADGFRYGMGAEVGISTNKIHARGPVGMDGLLIYKFLLNGSGHIVDDYSSGKKNFKHEVLK